MISFHFLIIFEQNDNRNFFVKILSNRDLKIQSFAQEDKKSGKRYTIRETVNALYKISVCKSSFKETQIEIFLK